MRDEFACAMAEVQLAHLEQDCDKCVYKDIAAPMCYGYFIADYFEKHYPDFMTSGIETAGNKTTEREGANDGT